MTTRVRFVREGVVAALQRRVLGGDVLDVDDSVVDFLVSDGWAVVEDAPGDENSADEVAVDESPKTGKRKAKATEPAEGDEGQAVG